MRILNLILVGKINSMANLSYLLNTWGYA